MLYFNKFGKIALASVGVIVAAKLFGRNPDEFPVESDFTPNELNAMLECVRDGRLHAFEAIYRYRMPRAKAKEIVEARVKFAEYLQSIVPA